MQASRNFTTDMTASPRLTDGVYYVDVVYRNRANESVPNQSLRERVAARAFLVGGKVVSSDFTNSEPGMMQFTDSIAFQNRGQCTAFCQGIGYPQETFAIYFRVNAAALTALP
jgi:hypothetical protein